MSGFPSASDIKDFFNTTSDVTKSVGADVQSVKEVFNMANYRSPRHDANAIDQVQPGGAFEKNRAANAAQTATDLAKRSGSMDFQSLFSGQSSGLITAAVVIIAAIFLLKALK